MSACFGSSRGLITISEKIIACKPLNNSLRYFCSCRLGRHGKVFLTIPSQSFTDEQKFIQKGEAPGTDSLFDLDPKDMVFFVGGVPQDIKVTPFTRVPYFSLLLNICCLLYDDIFLFVCLLR